MTNDLSKEHVPKTLVSPSDADLPLAEAGFVPVLDVPAFGFGVDVRIAGHVDGVEMRNGLLGRRQIAIVFVQDLGDQTQVLLAHVSRVWRLCAQAGGGKERRE